MESLADRKRALAGTPGNNLSRYPTGGASQTAHAVEENNCNSPEGNMDKLPLRQTVIASTFFAAARTDAFASPARFDFNFDSLSFGLG